MVNEFNFEYSLLGVGLLLLDCQIQRNESGDLAIPAELPHAMWYMGCTLNFIQPDGFNPNPALYHS